MLFLVTSACSLLLAPLVRSVSRKAGVLDLPGKREIHDRPIPRLGGLSIFIVFNLVVLIASQIDFFLLPIDTFDGAKPRFLNRG